MELRVTKIIVAKPKLAGDCNNGGIVIIFDLVIVTGNLDSHWHHLQVKLRLN